LNLRKPSIRSYVPVPLVLPVLALLLTGTTWTQARDLQPFGQELDSLRREALAQRHRHEYDRALRTLDTWIKSSEEYEQIKELLDAYQETAVVYLELNDQSKSDFYWQRAAAVLKGLTYPKGEAVHLYIQALRTFQSENYRGAREKVELAKAKSNDRNLGNRLMLLEGEIFLKLGEYEEAKTNFYALIVNSDEFEQAFLACRSNLGLSQIFLELGNTGSATRHAQSAVKIAEQNTFKRELINGLKLLTEIYTQNEEFEQAFLSTQKLLQFLEREKLQTPVFQQIAAQTTLEHQNSVIRKLQDQNEALGQSASRSELTAILTSAFLTIISLLAVSLYRNNQIKLRTNDLLKTKNKELESARDAAISAMKAKSNFLSTVTHELRTPLYAVTGLTHLLLEENPSEHQKEHLKSLKFSGDYLLNFINDILQINKIDADKLEPLKVEFKLKKVVNDVIDSLRQNAKEQKTQVKLHFDRKIPSTLLGDPLKLSQIFMNLIGNAIKFTREGKVDIVVKCLDLQDERIRIYVEVKDTGIGISEVQQQKIFDSFEQGSVQINREYGGTGLGLSIVRSLLGLFDTEIELESELGVGSTFFFEIELEVDKNKLEQEKTMDPEVEEFNFKGLHVLVVEDNKINQVITKKMLAKKDISCDIANNGNEAIEAARQNTYDLIFMDIHMPGISGEEATIQIRKFDKQIPIIALTAISMDDSLDSFYKAGCNAVVTKPFKPEVFYQEISKQIRARQEA